MPQTDSLLINANAIINPNSTILDSLMRDSVVAPEVIRVEPAEVFGTESILNSGHGTQLADLSFTSLTNSMCLVDNLIVKAIIIGIMIYYCYTIFYMRAGLPLLYKELTSTSKVGENPNEITYILSILIKRCNRLWALLCSIIVVKFVDIYMSCQTNDIPLKEKIIISAIALCTIPIIRLFHHSILKTIGNITLSRTFTNQISLSKDIWVSISVINLTPLILFTILYHGQYLNTLLYLIGLVAIAPMLYWLYKTYILFKEQNVSILHWFLYLCIVEIFPYTLLILILLRSS